MAQQIAQALVTELDTVEHASCYLVSRIGSPVKQPRIIDIRVSLADAGDIDAIRKPVDEIVADKLDKIIC